jgi:cytochrome c-type biogenesis protein CcmF
VFYSKGFAILQKLENHRDIPGAGFTKDDSVSVATLKVFAQTNSQYTVKPILISKGGANFAEPDTLTAESLVLQLQKVQGDKVTLGFKESNSVMQYVTLKAYKFPFINLLWLGTIMMVIGFLMAMWRRIETNQVKLKKI